MAFVVKPPEEENTNTGSTPLATGGGVQTEAPSDNNQGSAPTPSAPLDVGASAQEGQQANTQSKKAPASSGMFTNIQKYVSKNKPQAQRMATDIKQDYSGKVQNIKDVVGEKQQNLKDSLDDAKAARTDAETFAADTIGTITGTNPNTGESVLVGTPVDSSGNRQEAKAQDPGYQFDDETITNYSSLMGDDAGFGNFNYNDVQAEDLSQNILEAKRLAQRGQQASTEQGRQNLLKETFRDKGRYTRGMSGLDQLIMSGDEGARDTITGIQGMGKELISGAVEDDPTTLYDESRGVGQIGLDMANLVSGEQGAKADALARIKQQYTDAVSGIEDPIGEQLTEEQRIYKSLYGEGGQLESSFAEGGDNALPPELIEKLGLDNLGSLYDLDVSKYFKPLESELTAAGVMNQDDLAKLKALETISGKSSDYSGFDKVGGHNLADTFDMEGFKEDIAAKEASLKIPEWTKAREAFNKKSATDSQIEKLRRKYNIRGHDYTTVDSVNSPFNYRELKNKMGKNADKFIQLMNDQSQYQKDMDAVTTSLYSKPSGGFADFGSPKTRLKFGKKLTNQDIQDYFTKLGELRDRKLGVEE